MATRRLFPSSSSLTGAVATSISESIWRLSPALLTKVVRLQVDADPYVLAAHPQLVGALFGRLEQLVDGKDNPVQKEKREGKDGEGAIPLPRQGKVLTNSSSASRGCIVAASVLVNTGLVTAAAMHGLDLFFIAGTCINLGKTTLASKFALVHNDMDLRIFVVNALSNVGQDKLAWKLIPTYGLDYQSFDSIRITRARRHMKWLAAVSSEESSASLYEEFLTHHPDMLEELVALLVQRWGTSDSRVQFLVHSRNLHVLYPNVAKETPEDQKLGTDVPTKILELPAGEVGVQVVSTVEQLQEAVAVLRDEVYVGVSAEWTPISAGARVSVNAMQEAAQAATDAYQQAEVVGVAPVQAQQSYAESDLTRGEATPIRAVPLLSSTKGSFVGKPTATPTSPVDFVIRPSARNSGRKSGRTPTTTMHMPFNAGAEQTAAQRAASSAPASPKGQSGGRKLDRGVFAIPRNTDSGAGRMTSPPSTPSESAKKEGSTALFSIVPSSGKSKGMRSMWEASEEDGTGFGDMKPEQKWGEEMMNEGQLALDLPKDVTAYKDNEAQASQSFVSSSNQNNVGFDLTAAQPNTTFMSRCVPVRVALLQLACQSAVYVLDLDALASTVSASYLDGLLGQILAPQRFATLPLVKPPFYPAPMDTDEDSKSCLKPVQALGDSVNADDRRKGPIIAGFGSKLDFNYLAQTFPQITSFRVAFIPRLVELSGLAASNLGIPLQSRWPSLAAVATVMYGGKMITKERLCDWTRRPLNNDQIKYAALNAWILVDMIRLLDKRWGCRQWHKLHPGRVRGIVTAKWGSSVGPAGGVRHIHQEIGASTYTKAPLKSTNGHVPHLIWKGNARRAAGKYGKRRGGKGAVASDKRPQRVAVKLRGKATKKEEKKQADTIPPPLEKLKRMDSSDLLLDDSMRQAEGVVETVIADTPSPTGSEKRSIHDTQQAPQASPSSINGVRAPPGFDYLAPTVTTSAPAVPTGKRHGVAWGGVTSELSPAEPASVGKASVLGSTRAGDGGKTPSTNPAAASSQQVEATPKPQRSRTSSAASASKTEFGAVSWKAVVSGK